MYFLYIFLLVLSKSFNRIMLFILMIEEYIKYINMLYIK